MNIVYTSFEKFLQSKHEHKNARWNVSFSMLGERPNILNKLEVCCYENSIQVLNNMERTPLEVNQIQNLYLKTSYQYMAYLKDGKLKIIDLPLLQNNLHVIF